MELEDRIVAFAARCVKVCAALPLCCITSKECRQCEFCRSAVPIFNERCGKLRRGLRGGVRQGFRA